VEAVVDPHEPPMPPKATLEQGFQLAKSLAKGTPDARQILGTILKDQVREMV
jgi:pyruvate dehydrogenase (quinone)/pyruvate oxidase